MADRLPAEMLESIAHYLREDYHIIKAGSLVSRRWTPVFQRTLFADIKIFCPGPSDYPARFLDIISMSPWLGGYVKKLEFRQVDLAPKDVPETIVELTEHLQELTLHGEDCPITNIRAYEGVLQFDHITSLTLEDVREFPFSLFGLCVSLTHLTLNDTSFSRTEKTSATGLKSTQDGLTKLRHLAISPLAADMRDFVEWLCHSSCVFDLRQLKSFAASVEGKKGDGFLIKLLSIFAPTLEKLSIEPSLPCGHLEPSITMDPYIPHRFINLLSLTIPIEQDPRITVGSASLNLNFLPWLIAFLSTLPNPQHLQEFIIPCTLIGNRACDEIPLQGWRDLDIMLCNPTFSALKRVYIAFYRHSMTTHGFPRIQRILRSNLDGLEKKGILEIGKSEVRGRA